MIITLFDRLRDRSPKPVELSWEELCAMLSTHDHSHTEKEHVPLWSPAEFREGGRLRAADVVRVHAAVYDIDKVSAKDVSIALHSLHLMGVSFIYHTTWSRHTDTDTVHGRIIIKLAGPIAAVHWVTAWDQIHTSLGWIGDVACKDPTRRYYLPSAPPGTEATDFRLVHAGNAFGDGALPTVLP